jgi:hypothetical protein
LIGSGKSDRGKQPEDKSRPVVLAIPVRAMARTADGVKEYEGKLMAIGEGYAQICFDHPLAQSTEITVVVEFKDRRDREIRFKYEAKVTSSACSVWYEAAIDFGEGVGISGKDAREILTELPPEEG